MQNRLLLVEVKNVLIQIPEVDLPMPCPAEQPCRKKLRARSEALSSSHSNASVRGRPRRFSDVTSAQLRTGAGRPYWGPGLSAPKRPVGPPAEGLLEGGGPPAPLGPGRPQRAGGGGGPPALFNGASRPRAAAAMGPGGASAENPSSIDKT